MLQPYHPLGAAMPALADLAAPDVYLTLPDAPVAKILSRWSSDHTRPQHLRVYLLISTNPSVIRKWSLPRHLLRAVSTAIVNQVEPDVCTSDDCTPRSLQVLPHPDNEALIRIVDPADEKLGRITIDVDLQGLIDTLDLLDLYRDIPEPAPVQGVDAFLDEVFRNEEEENGAQINFFAPVELLVRIGRPAKSVHRVQELTNGSQEVHCRLSRHRSRKSLLVVELEVGQSLVTLWLDIARLAPIVNERWLRQVHFELPEGGVRVSTETWVLQIPDFRGLDASDDGHLETLNRDTAIILRIESSMSAMAAFDLLMPEIVLTYLQLLAKQWESEQANDAGTDGNGTVYALANHKAPPAPFAGSAPVDVTTESGGRPHPFAPGDRVQWAGWTKWSLPTGQQQQQFTVAEIAWAATEDEHPRMRLLDECGELRKDDTHRDGIWFRANSFEKLAAAA